MGHATDTPRTEGPGLRRVGRPRRRHEAQRALPFVPAELDRIWALAARDPAGGAVDPPSRWELSLMAQIKIYGRAERLRPRRDQLSDILHGCVMEAFAYPQNKRAHRFFCLDADDLRSPDGRSEDYTIIEVSLFEGRSAESKKRFYALVFDRFERELGVTPMDVEITLTETPRENWAMRGQAGDDLALDYRIDV